MRQLIREHMLFLVNAALVAGLVVLGTTLQARQAPEAGQTPPAAPPSTVEGRVILGAPSATVIETTPQPAPASASAPAPVRAPAPRPTVRGGEEEDDD